MKDHLTDARRQRDRAYLYSVISAVVAFLFFALMIFTPRPAQAADVHVCTDITDNALILYKMVEEQQEPQAIAEDILQAVKEGGLNEQQAQVLIDGLIFLVQAWGHPELNAQSFQVLAKQVCEARYGQIADRENI